MTAAQVSFMCNNLRKITFCLLKDGYLPNLLAAEEEKREDLLRERKGYFHKWVEDVDCSKEIPFIKPMALVEEVDSGKIYEVEYYNIRFSSDWQ